MSPAGVQDLTFPAHLLASKDLCLTVFLKFFFLASLPTQAKDPRGTASVMETVTTAQRVLACLDEPDQFELNHRLKPVHMDHGGTHGVMESYLYLIIVLKSSCMEEHKPH